MPSLEDDSGPVSADDFLAELAAIDTETEQEEEASPEADESILDPSIFDDLFGDLDAGTEPDPELQADEFFADDRTGGTGVDEPDSEPEPLVVPADDQPGSMVRPFELDDPAADISPTTNGATATADPDPEPPTTSWFEAEPAPEPPAEIDAVVHFDPASEPVHQSPVAAYPVDQYPATDLMPEQYTAEQFTPDPYPAEEDTAHPYTAEQYTAEQYTAEQYTAEPYPAEQYTAEPYPADPLPAEQYTAEPYPADPLPAEQYSAMPFPPDQYVDPVWEAQPVPAVSPQAGPLMFPEVPSTLDHNGQVPASPALDSIQPVELSRPVPIKRVRSGGWSRWQRMVIAPIAGVAVGLLAAVVITSIYNSGTEADETATVDGAETDPDSSTDPDATTALSVIDAEGDGTADPDLGGALAVSFETSPAEMNSIRFQPGTTELTETGQEAFDALATALAGDDNAVASIIVRTSSELTAAANLDLSQRQAAALHTRFAEQELGLQVAILGIGSTPPSPSHPTPNFVTISPGIGQPELKDLLGPDGAFTLGIDMTTGTLRPEAERQLSAVAELLAAAPNATFTLAGYAYTASTDAQNRATADLAVGTVLDALVERYEIPRNQLATVTPGPAPFEIPAEIGGHLTARVETRPSLAFELTALDPTLIAFDRGTTILTEASLLVIDQVSEAMVNNQGQLVVVNVATYTESTTSTNLELSRAQAQAVADALVERGVANTQLRVTGTGADTHLPDDLATLVTLVVG